MNNKYYFKPTYTLLSNNSDNQLENDLTLFAML